MSVDRLSLVVDKLSGIAIKLREKGLTEEAGEIEDVLELLIPEGKPDEVDLQAIKELEEDN